MARHVINIGAAPNDRSGDSAREGGAKINENFSTVWENEDRLDPIAYSGSWNDLKDIPGFNTTSSIIANGQQITEVAAGTNIDFSVSGNVLTITSAGGGGEGGISDLIFDTTPQLGGNLDLNGFLVGSASAAHLTKLSQLTATAAQLNHVTGTTSSIQAQLDSKVGTDNITFTTLQNNGSVGTGANQLAVGNHVHTTPVSIETARSSTYDFFSEDTVTHPRLNRGVPYEITGTLHQAGTLVNAPPQAGIIEVVGRNDSLLVYEFTYTSQNTSFVHPEKWIASYNGTTWSGWKKQAIGEIPLEDITNPEASTVWGITGRRLQQLLAGSTGSGITQEMLDAELAAYLPTDVKETLDRGLKGDGQLVPTSDPDSISEVHLAAFTTTGKLVSIAPLPNEADFNSEIDIVEAFGESQEALDFTPNLSRTDVVGGAYFYDTTTSTSDPIMRGPVGVYLSSNPTLRPFGEAYTYSLRLAGNRPLTLSDDKDVNPDIFYIRSSSSDPSTFTYAADTYRLYKFYTQRIRDESDPLDPIPGIIEYEVDEVGPGITAGGISQVSSPLTDGATITPNFNSARNFHVTLGGNRTLANPTNQSAGDVGRILIKQDGTGGRTLAFGANWKFAGGAPTLTATANAVDMIVYDVHASGEIYATFIANFT